MPGRRPLLAALALASALACEPGGFQVQRDGVAVIAFELISERVLAPTVTESTYRARCRAEAGPYDDVVVFASSSEAGVQIVDAIARCGRIAAGGTVLSVETIVLHRDPASAFDPNALGWITLAYGPHTIVPGAAAPAGARSLRYEVEVTDATGRAQGIAAGVSSLAAPIRITDGLVTATTQRTGTIRNADGFEVEVASGALFDPASLVWTLSRGARTEFALGVTRTLDGSGQPLGDVVIEEQGPAGLVERRSEGASGLATLAEEAGAFRWEFHRDGHLPVWRDGTLGPGQVLFVPSPWLPARNDTSASLSVLNGGEVDAGGVLVRFAAGAFPTASVATLTPVGDQSLPGLLPAGWSPLAAFWLELSVEPRAAGEAELRLADRLAPGERAFLARFDPVIRRWVETGTPVAASGDLAATQLAASGAYAILVPDIGDTAPPAPLAGAVIEPTATPFPLPDGLGATGIVTPPVAAASPDPSLVTAQGEVVVTHAGLLPSGLVLRADVDESYALRDGTTRAAPSYETFFVGYQRPGDGDPHTLHARFPLRPQVALGPDELDEATIALEVLPVTAFEGGFFDPSGGRVGAPGVLVTAPPGAVDRPRAVELRAIDVTRFADLLPAGAGLVAFELSAELREGARVGASFGPQEPDADFVLTRFVQSGGRSGLEPRLRYESDEFGVLRSAEPSSGPRLPGVTGSGTYVLVRVDGPRALVEGVARDTSGQPTAGLAVTITGEPWLTFSAAAGRWQLVAPPGQAEVVVTDPRNGDRGTQNVLLADANAVGAADLATQPAGPRVVEIDPANGATGVRSATPIRVLFSERVAPLAPGDLVLLDADGNEVPAILSTNLPRTEATLLPVDPLAGGRLHTLVLAAAIADPAGLPLEGPREFQFTTAAFAERGAGAELVSWEPGAQTAACDDVPGIDRADPSIVCVVGSQGTADPDVPVILVNDTTGTTATVRSRADGSFESFIDAAVDDFVSATFVNANGTRIRIPVQRQLFDDGSVALFEGGGILEAESDGGPVQILVQPGSIPNKTKFKVDPLPFAEVLALMQSSPPDGGQLLSAVSLTISGDVPTESPEVSLPVDEAQLQLQPGEDPATHAFALAGVTESDDGGKAYQIVDKLHYEDGRLVTRSFPFVALVVFLGQALVEEFATIVITSIFLGDDAITTTGIVGTCQLTQVTGACVGEVGLSSIALGGPDIRPLPGAVVIAQPFEPGEQGTPPVNARAGRIPTGAVYAVSGRDGRYVLALALVNDAFGLIGREQAYQLVATHPRFGAPVVDVVVFNDFTLFNPFVDRVAAKNLLFRVSNPFGSIAELSQAGRPRLSIGHDPTRPAPAEAAELRIFSTHRKAAPVVEVEIAEVAPLVVGDDVSEDDIALLRVSSVQPGPNAVREEWSITAAKPAAVRLLISASVDDADPAIADYPIHFGGAPPPVVDPVKSADPNDERGPFVLRAWPPADSQALAPGDAIFVAFNEAVTKAIEIDPAGITLSPGAGAPLVDLDPTQREATIRFPDLAPATPYTLTLTSAVRDLAEPPNGLDQDPITQGSDSYQLHFETTPVRKVPLAGITSGGGALFHGNYAFVLDRTGTGDGMLRAYDLRDPSQPTSAGSISLPAFPRDLALIGSYSFKRKKDGPAETRDLLAVVGGDLGAGSDDEGNQGTGNSYLNIIDITDPHAIQRVAGALLSVSASAAPTKVAWSPPLLTYLLSDGDVQPIEVLHLQKFLIGSFATPADFAQFPAQGEAGRDANGDGDFVDADDVLPLPPREPAGIAGKDLSFLVDESNQRILDYFFDADRLQLALALSVGQLLDDHGLPTTTDAPAAYRTLVNNGAFLDREDATVELAGTRPKRVQVVYGVATRNAAGLPLVADLALVSLAPETSAKSELAVIDISDPANPVLLSRIEVPGAFGVPQSIALRDDGQIVLESTNDLLLLDPEHFGEAQPLQGVHPALLGQIDGAGSGARANGVRASGLHVVSLGGRSEIVQSAPELEFVQFPTESALVDPSQLVGDATLRDAKLAGMTGARTLVPGRLRGVAGAEESLDPPSPAVHYHVLVRAPGTAGATIELGLESLDIALEPIGRKGFHFAPSQALREETLSDLGQEPREGCDAPSKPLRAFRLSADPEDPFYDVYLSIPFALTVEEMNAAELATLRASPEREILWSGHFLRAFLEPSLENNDTLDLWAARVVDERLQPRANAFARSLSGDYIVGQNPPPPNGHAEAPGTMGSVAAHSGELRTNTVDLSVDTRLLPIVFERASGSQDLYEGPFGRGWDFGYNQRLVELREDVFPPGSVLPVVDRGGNGDEIAKSKDLLLHTGEGGAVIYEFKGDASSVPPEYAADPLLQGLDWITDAAAYYLPTPGIFDALVRFNDGTFGRLTPDGMQYRYSADGKLQKIVHRYEDNALDLQYNSHAELIRVQEVDPPERFIDVGYYRLPGDGEFRADTDVNTANAYHDGKIAKLVDFSGRDVQFFYDAAGALVRREGVDVTTTLLGGAAGRAKTTYGYGQCSESGSANNLTGIIPDASGGNPLFSVSGFDSGERDVAKNGTGVGGPVQIDITHQSTAKTLAQGGGQTNVTEPDGSGTAMTLDARGLPQQVRLSGPNGADRTYDYEHAPDGRVEKVTEPAGNSVEYVYDDNNQNLRSRGNLIAIHRKAGGLPGGDLDAGFAYDALYNQRSGTQLDFNGTSISYTLTDGGRQVGSIAYPDADPESFTFDSYGQVLTHSLPDGVELAYEYDPQRGDLTVEHRGGFAALYGYQGVAGDRGNATSITPAHGAHSAIVYDELDRPVSMTRDTYVEEFGYDKTGRVEAQSSTTDAGQTLITTHQYDARGFREQVTVQGVEVDGVPANLVTVFTPDSLGRVHAVSRPGGAVETLEYDHLDQIVSRTFGEMVTTIERDDNGNPKKVTTGSLETQYVYDAHDRLRESSSPAATTTYDYFGNGELQHVRVEDAVDVVQDVTYEIDALGRITRTLQQTDGAPAETTIDYAGPVTTITDPANQITTTTRASDGWIRNVTNGVESIIYTRNGRGSVESETSQEAGATFLREFSYDTLDHPTSITFGGITTSFTPRPDGTITSVTNPLGHTIHYGPTALGEVAERTTPEGVALKHRYAAHRESSGVEDAQGPARQYGYDTSLRQTSTTYRDGGQSVYTYAGSSAVPGPDTVTLPGGSITPSYDPDGRLIAQTVSFGGDTRDETFDYDGLDRIVTATYPGGNASYDYDKLGPLHSATFSEPAGSFTVDYGVRNDGTRESVGYPSGVAVSEQRDLHGRLMAVLPSPGGAVVDSTTYAAAELVGTRIYGGGAIVESNEYDPRKRLLARRYVNGAGALLAEERLVYDDADNVVARQFLHRGGRADFFAYDRDDRMVRADIGARPELDVATVAAPIGFAPPAGVPGAWSRGLFARSFGYDPGGLDLLEGATPLDPDGQAPLFAVSRSVPDANLQATEIDYGGALGSFVRGPADELGHSVRSRLFPRAAAGAPAGPVEATLGYDGLSHLLTVERDDGATIEYLYQHTGLFFQRTVSCPGGVQGCVPAETAYVYDGGRRLEEYEASTGDVVARFYYADDDYPIAADLPAPGGGLARHFLLVDSLGSVMAVANAGGQVVERIHYDAFGLATIEAPDTQAPVLSRVSTDAGGALRIELSERVVGNLGTPAAGPALATNVAAIGTKLRVRANGTLVPGDLRFEESAAPFATTFGFVPQVPLSGTLRIELDAGAVTDEWNNPNPQQTTVDFAFQAAPGTTLLQSVPSGSTAPSVRARSAVGSAASFHGHFFDADSGLVYMRSRFYDPATGLFLTRDPEPYADSVNPYVAFGHNPATLRDPSGAFLRRWLAKLAVKSPRLGGRVLRGYDDVAAGLAQLRPKRVQRLNGQTPDGLQPVPNKTLKVRRNVAEDRIPTSVRVKNALGFQVTRPKRVEDLVREAAAKGRPLRGLIIEIVDDDVIKGAAKRMSDARGAARTKIQRGDRAQQDMLEHLQGNYDYVTFVSHGNGLNQTVGGWTAEQLAMKLKKAGITAKRFEISACNAGSCDGGVAQVYDLVDSFAPRLVRATGRPVDASASLVITDANGVIRSVKSMKPRPGSTQPDDLVVDEVEGTRIFHTFGVGE